VNGAPERELEKYAESLLAPGSGAAPVLILSVINTTDQTFFDSSFAWDYRTGASSVLGDEIAAGAILSRSVWSKSVVVKRCVRSVHGQLFYKDLKGRGQRYLLKVARESPKLQCRGSIIWTIRYSSDGLEAELSESFT
jgi:hypothetical protein